MQPSRAARWALLRVRDRRPAPRSRAAPPPPPLTAPLPTQVQQRAAAGHAGASSQQAGLSSIAGVEKASPGAAGWWTAGMWTAGWWTAGKWTTGWVVDCWEVDHWLGGGLLGSGPLAGWWTAGEWTTGWWTAGVAGEWIAGRELLFPQHRGQGRLLQAICSCSCAAVPVPRAVRCSRSLRLPCSCWASPSSCWAWPSPPTWLSSTSWTRATWARTSPAPRCAAPAGQAGARQRLHCCRSAGAAACAADCRLLGLAADRRPPPPAQNTIVSKLPGLEKK